MTHSRRKRFFSLSVSGRVNSRESLRGSRNCIVLGQNAHGGSLPQAPGDVNLFCGAGPDRRWIRMSGSARVHSHGQQGKGKGQRPNRSLCPSLWRSLLLLGLRLLLRFRFGHDSHLLVSLSQGEWTVGDRHFFLGFFFGSFLGLDLPLAILLTPS